MTGTKVPDDGTRARNEVNRRTAPRPSDSDLVKSLETLYEAGIISSGELEDVLEGWSSYVRQR